MALKIPGFRIDSLTAKSVAVLTKYLAENFKLKANPARVVVSNQSTKNIAIIPATPSSSAPGVQRRRGGISLSQATKGGDITTTGSVVTIDARFAGQDIQYLHVIDGEVVAGPTLTRTQLAAYAKKNKDAASPEANASRAAALYGLAALSGDAIAVKKHGDASPMDVVHANMDFLAVASITSVFPESGQRLAGKKKGGTTACCCCTTCCWGSCCSSAEAGGARVLGDPTLQQYLACLDVDALLAETPDGEASW